MKNTRRQALQAKALTQIASTSEVFQQDVIDRLDKVEEKIDTLIALFGSSAKELVQAADEVGDADKSS